MENEEMQPQGRIITENPALLAMLRENSQDSRQRAAPAAPPKPKPNAGPRKVVVESPVDVMDDDDNYQFVNPNIDDLEDSLDLSQPPQPSVGSGRYEDRSDSVQQQTQPRYVVRSKPAQEQPREQGQPFTRYPGGQSNNSPQAQRPPEQKYRESPQQRVPDQYRESPHQPPHEQHRTSPQRATEPQFVEPIHSPLGRHGQEEEAERQALLREQDYQHQLHEKILQQGRQTQELAVPRLPLEELEEEDAPHRHLAMYDSLEDEYIIGDSLEERDARSAFLKAKNLAAAQPASQNPPQPHSQPPAQYPTQPHNQPPAQYPTQPHNQPPTQYPTQPHRHPLAQPPTQPHSQYQEVYRDSLDMTQNPPPQLAGYYGANGQQVYSDPTVTRPDSLTIADTGQYYQPVENGYYDNAPPEPNNNQPLSPQKPEPPLKPNTDYIDLNKRVLNHGTPKKTYGKMFSNKKEVKENQALPPKPRPRQSPVKRTGPPSSGQPKSGQPMSGQPTGDSEQLWAQRAVQLEQRKQDQVSAGKIKRRPLRKYPSESRVDNMRDSAASTYSNQQRAPQMGRSVPQQSLAEPIRSESVSDRRSPGQPITHQIVTEDGQRLSVDINLRVISPSHGPAAPGAAHAPPQEAPPTSWQQNPAVFRPHVPQHQGAPPHYQTSHQGAAPQYAGTGHQGAAPHYQTSHQVAAPQYHQPVPAPQYAGTGHQGAAPQYQPVLEHQGAAPQYAGTGHQGAAPHYQTSHQGAAAQYHQPVPGHQGAAPQYAGTGYQGAAPHYVGTGHQGAAHHPAGQGFQIQPTDPAHFMYAGSPREAFTTPLTSPHPSHNPSTSPYPVLPPISTADGHSQATPREGGGSYAEQYHTQRTKKIDYKVYTLDDYRKLHREIRLGGLGPDKDNLTTREKQEKRQRQLEYAKAVKQRTTTLAGRPPRPAPNTAPHDLDDEDDDDVINRRKVALQYAKSVPKPKLRPAARDLPRGRQHNRAVSHTQSEPEVEMIDLQKLQQRHDQERHQVAVMRQNLESYSQA